VPRILIDLIGASWVQFETFGGGANDPVDFSRMNNCGEALCDYADEIIRALIIARRVFLGGDLDNEYIESLERSITMEIYGLLDLFDEIKMHRSVFPFKRKPRFEPEFWREVQDHVRDKKDDEE